MARTSVRIYTPESRLRHPGHLLSDMFRDLAAGRELAWRLAIRDISAQYRQAALGIAWAFILPLANSIIWVFLRRNGVVAMGDTPVPYPVYVFAGTILWAILSDALNSPLRIAAAARSMLVKINFPREALVLSGIYQTLFNGGIRILVLLAAMMVMSVHPGWSLLLFPLAVLSLVLAGTAIGLLLTPLGLLYTDVGKSIPLSMQFLMYLAPVVFPVPRTGFASRVFELNPLTPLIVTGRDWLTGTPAAYVHQFIIINLLMIVLLLFVGILYRLAMPILIERMGS